MSYKVFVVAILSMLLASDSLRSQDKIPEKVPVPDAEAIEAANKQVDQKFQRKVASARSLTDKISVGFDMREAAQEATEDAPLRYVLLNRAISMGIEGRSAYLVVTTLQELQFYFDANTLALEADAIRKLSKVVKESDETVITWLVRHAVSSAIDADQFELAAEVSGLALTDLKKFRAPAFKSSMKEWANEVRRQKDEFDSLSTQIEAVKQEGTNSEAALAVGKFRCFQQENWSKGLPLLARGSDAALAEVAAQEPEQLDRDGGAPIDRCRSLAEGWYEYSKTATGSAQEESQKRSLFWSRNLLVRLDDAPEATSVSRRIEELEKKIPLGSVPWGATATFSFEKPTWKQSKQGPIVVDVNGRASMTEIPCRVEIVSGTMVDGKVGKGLSLVRSGDRDLVHGENNFAHSTSICCWVNLREWPSKEKNDLYVVGSLDDKFGGQTLAIAGQSAGFVLGSAGKLVHCRFTPKTEIQTNVWYHLAGTYDGQELKMYVNGCPTRSTRHRGAITAADGTTQIGRRNAQLGRGFVGTVDEVVFFARPLSYEEVDTLYRRGLRGKSLSD